MGAAAEAMDDFDAAYAKTDWSRFSHLPAFAEANRRNAEIKATAEVRQALLDLDSARANAVKSKEQARLAEARTNALLVRAARRERRAFIGLGRLLHRARLEVKPADLALRALQAMARGRSITSP